LVRTFVRTEGIIWLKANTPWNEVNKLSDNNARYDFGVVTDFVLPEPDHDAAQLNEGAGFAFVIFVPFPRAVKVANRAAVPETAVHLIHDAELRQVKIDGAEGLGEWDPFAE